ncbi:MAG: acid phosphatase [Ancalomicrobiaceae bacterium]|nr:acid phosphatase [Ancalomicrobiaceae bacterium]
MTQLIRFAPLGAVAALLCAGAPAAAQTVSLDKIKHILVIYLENRSFDQVYGLFPGADGLANSKNPDGSQKFPQLDPSGKPYDTLPPVLDSDRSPKTKDARFKEGLPNGPFLINNGGKDTGNVGPNETTGDMIHAFFTERAQIDGGKMDHFVSAGDSGSLLMGYYDGARLPLWQYAKDYVLMDNFFHAAFGGSFLNHFWLVCACTPVYPNAPDSVRNATLKLADAPVIKPSGEPVEPKVTADYYAVNTLFPENPRPVKTGEATILPNQTLPTIGDRLTEKGIDWRWYSGGWNDAVAETDPTTGVASKADPLFQYHHQVFAFFTKYAAGTEGRKQHLKDLTDLVADIANDKLPPVAFYKPIGENNEHPGYTNLIVGERHVRDIIQQVQASPAWASTVIIVTYDEHGGQWDHVAPPTAAPKADQFGPGSRVPTLVISPFAKRGFIDHTEYDTTAILKLIETRYGLAPLGTRDAGQADMTNALDPEKLK